MTETIDAYAARLIAAHDGGPVIETVPTHLVPADWPAIYVIQDAIIAQIGAVGGWKILAGAASLNCAPIPANRFFAEGVSIDARRHRLVIAEVEFAVTLGQDLAADADTAAAEAAIASVHPIIEMVGSPFVDRDAIDANSKFADLQSNGIVIVGAPLDPAIKASLPTLAVSLYLDGEQAHARDTGASWADVVEAVRWLAGHAASRGLPLRAGNVIITGARALAPNPSATHVEGRLGEWGTVRATMTY